VDAFEHEFAAIQSLYAVSQHPSGRLSRSAARLGCSPGGHSLAAASVGPASGSADAEPLETLMKQAVRLRDTIASLTELVPVQQCGAAAYGRRLGWGREDASELSHGEVTHSPAADYRRGGLTSTEVADLAALRALTTSKPAAAEERGDRLKGGACDPGADQRSQAADTPCPEVLSGTPDHENASVAANGVPLQEPGASDETPEGPPLSLASPDKSQHVQAHADAERPSMVGPPLHACDACIELHVTSLEGVRVPYAAVAALEGGALPSLWVSWRVPGAASDRSWCHLGLLAEQELKWLPNGGFCVSAMHPAADAQVPLLLRNLQMLQSLGQGAAVQCELWILTTADPDEAFVDTVSAPTFVGVATVPLQPLHLQTAPTSALASGWFDLQNVLEGTAGGSVLVQLRLRRDCALASGQGPNGVAPAPCPAIAGLREDAVATGGTTVHSFQVSIMSMSNLPDEGMLREASLPVPVGRYIRCYFLCLVYRGTLILLTAAF
jgi:hypothetical protein